MKVETVDERATEVAEGNGRGGEGRGRKGSTVGLYRAAPFSTHNITVAVRERLFCTRVFRGRSTIGCVRGME